jgi:hypothetical protein
MKKITAIGLCRPSFIVLALAGTLSCGKPPALKAPHPNSSMRGNVDEPAQKDDQHNYYTIGIKKRDVGVGYNIHFKINTHEVQSEIRVSRVSMEPLGKLEIGFTEAIPKNFIEPIYDLVDFGVNAGIWYTYKLNFKTSQGLDRAFRNLIFIPKSKP